MGYKLQDLNNKIKYKGLKLTKKKNYYLVQGNKTKKWRYDRILLRSFNERSLHEWIELVDKLEEFNNKIIERQTNIDIINKLLKTEISQDNSSTSYKFIDESEGFWNYANNKIDKG